MKRILKFALLLVLIAVIAGWFVLRAYLRSTGVASQVTAKLSEVYGGKLGFENVDIGLTGTTITGLRFFEPDQDSDNAIPWLAVESANIDLTLTDLIRGESAPGKIDIQGATVTLRFDEDGKLITQFPQQDSIGNGSLPWDRIPQITATKSTIVFRKEGHAELIARNVQASIVKESGQFKLSGSADSDLGPLILKATLAKEAQRLEARINTASTVPVTQDLLNRLPFVPRGVFREIRFPRGAASAGLTLHYDLRTNLTEYQLDVDATNTEFHIPDAAIFVRGASGKVNIKNNVVVLQGVTGHAFGGTVAGDGRLVFHSKVSSLSFPNLQLDNLDAKDIPEAWGISGTIRKSITNGKLFGKVKLDIAITEAGLSPETAAAVVASAAPSSAGAPWLRQAVMVVGHPRFRFRIDTEGKGEIRDPRGKQEPIEFDWRLGPKPAREGDGALFPRFFEILHGASTLLATYDPPADLQDVQPKTEGPPKHFDFNLNLKNVSLAELLKNEDVKLPFPVDGKISFNVKASIPVDQIQELKAYKAEGSAQIKDLVVANLKLDELATDFEYTNGALYLKSLRGKFDDADKINVITGSGHLQLVPLGNLHAVLKVQGLPLEKATGLPADQVRGAVSGSFTLDTALDKVKQASDLDLRGKLASERLQLYGFTLENVRTSMTQKDGVLNFPDLQASIEGEVLKAAASVQLTETRDLLAKIDVRDLNTTTLHKLAAARKIDLPPIRGTLNAETVVRGKFNPPDFTVSGDIAAPSLKLDELETKDVRVHWKLGDNNITATSVEALLYDGKASGSAMLPLDGKSASRVDLDVKDLNIARLAKDVRMPIAVDGRVAGAVKVKVTPAAEKKESKVEFNVDFQAPKLRVQNIPTEKLKGKVEYLQDKIEYDLTGSTLGGTFDLQGQIPRGVKPNQPEPEKGKEGRLRIKDARVSRLLDALGAGTEREVRGTINLDVRFTHDENDGWPRGQGKLRIDNLRWHDRVIGESVQGDVILADQQLRIRNLQGELANGSVSGQLAYYFRERERSWFTLNMDSVDLGNLLAPWAEKKIEGSAQMRLRGRLGSVWSGNIEIDMPRGKVFGLDVAQWRLPATWTYAPDVGRAQLDVNETTAQLVQGRAKGKMILAWEGGHARIDGFVHVTNVELRELLRQTMGATDLGAGRTTAKVEFKGNEVRSMKDITAKLVASFDDTQALQAPVLKQVAPYLGMGASTTFQKGNLIARLNNGVIRIEQMALQGSNVQVFVDGTMTLEQRLNLNVVAKTGDIGWPTVRLGPLGLRVPIAGPVPLVVAQEVSAILSNRVVHLDVTGTPRSPVIRARPLQILSDEAVRFFLNRANFPVTLNP